MPASSQREPAATSSGLRAAAIKCCSLPGLRRTAKRTFHHDLRAGLRRCFGAQHVLRQGQHHRSRPSRHRNVKGMRNDFGNARRVADFLNPLGHAAKKGAKIHFLEGVSATHVAADLADEQKQRRRILLRNVNSAGRVGCAGAARHHGDAGAAGHLAVGLGHHRRAAFMARRHHVDRAAMQSVEQRQIAFARHAEGAAHALRLKAPRQQRAAIHLLRHCLPRLERQSLKQPEGFSFRRRRFRFHARIVGHMRHGRGFCSRFNGRRYRPRRQLSALPRRHRAPVRR